MHMLHARTLWLDGEDALSDGDSSRAVAFFADALRASVADGDPFSGWFFEQPRGEGSGSYTRYLSAVHTVLVAQPGLVDAQLVHGKVLCCMAKYAEAESVLSACITVAPHDVYGTLSLRGNMRGNLGRWSESLADIELASLLFPEEPIFHYWAAVTMCNLPAMTGDTRAAVIARYRRFLELAPPEGRKVCEALYTIALLDIRTDDDSTNAEQAHLTLDQKTKFERAMQAAQAAETAKLPVFERTKCDSKSMAEEIMKAVRFSERTPPVPPLVGTSLCSVNELRVKGNSSFKSGHFAAAVTFYTAALKLAPNHAELLANRAAAYNATGLFTAGVADALAAIKVRPGWAKAYYRAAQAHLGRVDGVAALEAAEQAAVQMPNDDLVTLMRANATRLAEAQRVSPPHPTSLAAVSACAAVWDRVKFKQNVHVVSLDGGAAFSGVADALHSLLGPAACGLDTCSKNAVRCEITLVLAPGVYNEQIVLTGGADMHVQLLGWNCAAPALKSEVTELRCTGVRGDDHCLIMVEGAHLCLERLLLIQPVGAPRTAAGHCVAASDGADVRVVDCIARTPDSP